MMTRRWAVVGHTSPKPPPVGIASRQIVPEVNEEQTAPLLEHYRSQGLLVEVSGVGEITEVAAAIEARLG